MTYETSLSNAEMVSDHPEQINEINQIIENTPKKNGEAKRVIPLKSTVIHFSSAERNFSICSLKMSPFVFDAASLEN